MIDINYLAVVVAGVAALVAAAAYYGLTGKQYERLSEAAKEAAAARSPLWVLPFELVKHLVLAAVAAGLAAGIGIVDWPGAAVLGLALWVGFPVVLLAGSVVHERVPWRLAALHAGDWLIKLEVIAAVVGVWR